ncbi:hypothetical protein ACW7GZ_14570, partial [Luteimonas sp. A537]
NSSVYCLLLINAPAVAMNYGLRVSTKGWPVHFAKYCNWPSPYFLPEDNVSVIAGGSTFGWLDGTDTCEAIGAIEEIVGTKMAPAFWEAAGAGTMGQLVDRLRVASGP